MNTKLFILITSLIFIFVGYFISALGFPSEYGYISNIFIVLMAIPSFYYFVKSVGLKKGLTTIVFLIIFAQLIEGQALVTNFPYSEFAYSDKISGKLFGIIPWTIGFAWTPLLLASVFLANQYTKNKYKLVLISAIILVVFDLVLDPGATAAGLWTWKNQVGFYNVPLQNFFGWFVSGVIGTAIYLSQKIDTSKLNPSILISAILSLSFWIGAAIFYNFIIVILLGIFTTSLMIYKLK
jgi:putative membrane protein